MATVGTFGKVVFEVSSEKALSFESIKHGAGARISQTEIVGSQPITEFLGLDSESVSFDLKLLSQLGVNPQEEYQNLYDAMKDGLASQLIIGDKPFGGSGVRWIIENLDAVHSHFVGNKLSWIDVSVSLIKYVKANI